MLIEAFHSTIDRKDSGNKALVLSPLCSHNYKYSYWQQTCTQTERENKVSGLH